jgi:hypothetical protein
MSASADSWRWKAETRRYKFNEGLSFEYQVRPYDHGYYAHIDLTIRKRSKVLAHYSNIGIDDLFASPKENLFVVLSNSGLPGTAVAVFDNRGDLLLHVEHAVAVFDYCQESIYVNRTWHKSEKGDVQFDGDESVYGITLLDCHGKRVNLMQAISNAFNRTASQRH